MRGRTTSALTALRDAIEAGYPNLEKIRDDPDFASIRDHPEFLEIVAVPEEKAANR